MTSYDVYSPTTRPIGSYDSTLIPTRITQRGGIVYVNKLGAPLLPDDAELTVGWLMSRLADMTANDYSLNRLYYDGDHWQMAEGWSGPRPDAGERDAGLALRAIERSFVSKNCIKEVTSRTTNSILSREPSWFLTNKSARGSNETLTAAEEALRREGEAVLTEWWDRTNAAEVLSQAVVNALLGKRSSLRLYVPPGLLTPDGRVPVAAGDLSAAASCIELEAPYPHEGGVIVDRASKRRYGVFIYTEADGIQGNLAEVVYTAPPALGGPGAVINSATPPPTIIRIIGNPDNIDGTNDPAPAALVAVDGTELLTDVNVRQAVLQLGGRLTIFEIEVDQLVTQQVRQLQRAINKAMTMGDHNVEVAGFVERTIFNGQMPGHYEADPERPGRKRFVRDNYVTGGGAINFINGIPVYDAQGVIKGVADPSIHVRQPSLPDAFERTERWYYAALLDECHQAHYMLAGSEYVSGESRVQSRAEYVETLRRIKKVIDAAGRWLLETVLALSSWFADKPLMFEPMRASFSCRVIPGPATAEGIRSAIELRSAGGLSREGMMERTDIEDVDAEVRRIENEEAQGVVQPNKAPVAVAPDGTSANTPPNGASAASANGRNGRPTKPGTAAPVTE
jgi:hypothetical protein